MFLFSDNLGWTSDRNFFQRPRGLYSVRAGILNYCCWGLYYSVFPFIGKELDYHLKIMVI